MTDPVIADRLLEQVGRLSVPLQRRVLDFAEALALSELAGTDLADLRPLVGSISPDDLEAMREAIEADCEQVGSLSVERW